MKCRYCGSNNPSSGVSCVKCGRGIDAIPSSSGSERPEKSEERNPKQIPGRKETAPLKLPSENPQQRNSRRNGSLSTLNSPIEESPGKPKASAWELYPRTGGYFVLDSTKEPESGVKEEEEDSSDLLARRYKIIRRLGSGGMSVVYLARDTKMETNVVIKEMSASSNMKDNGEYLKKRFDEEAKLLYRLHWSGIPKVTEYFSDNDSNYLVMEYVHGENLEKVLDVREIPVITIYEFVDWMGQLLETLIYLHSCDPPVIHRDIKPSNIMLNDEGDIILVDFGLAKSLSYFTSPQTKVGTRGYASPEHYLGKTSKASDIYSLGASFHYLLTHEKPETRLPFEFPPVSAYREDLGDDVDYIMEKMLEKTEKNRYASAAEVLEDLNLLSDFLAESYQGEEFASEEVETKQSRESAKTGLFRKPTASPPPTSRASANKISPASSPKPVEEVKSPKKYIQKEIESPRKEVPAKNYGTNAVKARTRVKCKEKKTVYGGKPDSEPKSAKPIEADKPPDEQINGKIVIKSTPETMNGRHKKNGDNKAPVYKRNGDASDVEVPDLSRPVNSEMPPLQKPSAKMNRKPQKDDEFAEESFIEKSAGLAKIFVICILALALGAAAWLFGPSIVRKYLPDSNKTATQGGTLAAEPSMVPSASPSVVPDLTGNQQEQDNLRQGKRYLSEGENDKAIMVFTVILAKDPNNTEALLGRGTAYAAIKDRKSAFNDFSGVISIDPKNLEAYLKRSEINMSREAHKAAEKDLGSLLSLSPDHSRALYLRGICFEKEGKLDLAIADLSRIPDNLEKDKNTPLFKDAVEALGRIYLARANASVMSGKYDSAISDFKQSLKYKPDSSETYKLMAEAYLNTGNIAESIELYKKVLEKKPDSKETKDQLAKLHYLLGASRMKENKPALAIQYFETSLKFNDGNSEVKGSLIEANGIIASKLMGSKKYKEAAEYYSKILELDPESKETYFSRGLSYYNSGNKVLARKDFDSYAAFKPEKKSLDRIPRDMRPGKPSNPKTRAAAEKALFEEHLKNAEDALKREDYSQTEQNADLALKIDNRSGHAFFLKGVANLKMERPDVAETCFLSVVKYDDEDTIAKIQSVKFLVRMYSDRAKEEVGKKNYKVADEYALKAIDLDKNNAGAYLSRGIIHLETNRKKEAIVFLEKAKEKSEGIDTPVYSVATELIEKAGK